MLGDLYRELHRRLTAGERILIHQEELGDRVTGVVAGYLLWSDRLPSGPQAITVLEHMTGHPMGPTGRELVAFAGELDAGLGPPRTGGRRSAAARVSDTSRSRRPPATGTTGATGSSCAGSGCVGTHGVLPEEKDPGPALRDRPRPGRRPGAGRGQRPSGRHRRLRRGGRRRSAGVVSGLGSFELLEALAGAVADAALWPSTPGSTAVTVHLRKLRPPLAVDVRHGRGPDHPATGDRARRPDRRRSGPSSASAPTSATAGPTCAGPSTSSGPGTGPPVTAVSRVYETEPVGGPDGQGPYLNVVVELAVAPGADPYRLLEECRRLEAAAGRVRAARWGPRTLDADVLWIDGVALDDPDLTVPHPRWRERRFVLAPLGRAGPGPGRRGGRGRRWWRGRRRGYTVSRSTRIL